MTYFVRDPSEQAKDAERKLAMAETILAAAEKAYRKDSSRANLIALKAAVRLGKETQAEFQEWHLG